MKKKLNSKFKVKESCGVALFDHTGKKVLMLKKRCTYHFCDFVDGKYKANDEDHLKYMFSHMTPREKIYILSGNFDEVWFARWLTHHLCLNDVTDHYKGEKKIELNIEWFHNCESKYIELYHSNVLKRLMSQSESISGVWELPKGRRNPQEQRLTCALREFHEEVNIKNSDYRLIDLNPHCFEIVDESVIYRMYIYTAALTNQHWRPNISFEKFCYFSEADDMMWCSMGDIQRLKISEKNRDLLGRQFMVSREKLKKN